VAPSWRVATVSVATSGSRLAQNWSKTRSAQRTLAPVLGAARTTLDQAVKSAHGRARFAGLALQQMLLDVKEVVLQLCRPGPGRGLGQGLIAAGPSQQSDLQGQIRGGCQHAGLHLVLQASHELVAAGDQLPNSPPISLRGALLLEGVPGDVGAKLHVSGRHRRDLAAGFWAFLGSLILGVRSWHLGAVGRGRNFNCHALRLPSPDWSEVEEWSEIGQEKTIAGAARPGRRANAPGMRPRGGGQ